MANEWLTRARSWYAQRNVREQRSLVLGGLVLLGVLLYGVLYAPLEQARNKLLTRLPELRAELRLMRVQTAEIERLRTSMAGAGSGTLEQRIKASAAVFDLGSAFNQFTTLAEDRIQLRTEPLANDTWVDWLADLAQRGVTVVRCRVTPADQGGTSILELTLAGGQ